MKKIPTGIEDFDRVIREGYYYVDKSRYIKTMEDEDSYILFNRPRRMGKSLFSRMMMSYYDIAKKDQFDQLFGNLWIGKNPTDWANKFLVLRFDFSQVGNDMENLPRMFHNYCFGALDDFFVRYDEIFTESERIKVLSQAIVKDAINALISITKRKSLHTYLFIDEYDNFTNTVLAARGVKAHSDITHGEGFYRDFFKCCKGTFDRIFMTGVTPVTYDDLTSGFNIVDVIGLNPQFNQAIGISDTELRDMIEYYRTEGAISMGTEDIISDLKPWYDNFCFSNRRYGIDPPMYNTYSVLRYMRELISVGEPPRNMVDRAARTEPHKLDYLVMSKDLANREERIKILKEICASGYTIGNVEEQFPASECGDEVNFKSMLFYLGTLSYGGYNKYGETKLQVPNRNMGELYLKYMMIVASKEGCNINHEWDKLQAKIRQAALFGDWQPMVDKVGEIYNQYSSLRNTIRGEADVQGFVRGLLCLNDYYDVWPELELGGGYTDVLLIPKSTADCPTRHSYIIELKYLKADDNNIDAKITEACHQLNTYVADKHLTDSPMLKGSPLTKIYIVFQSNNIAAAGTCM